MFDCHRIDLTLKLLLLDEHRWDGIISHAVDFIHACSHCQKKKSWNTLLQRSIDSSSVCQLTPCSLFHQPNNATTGYLLLLLFVELIISFDNTAVAVTDALLSIFGRYGATFYLRDNAGNFVGDVIGAIRSLMDISADYTIPYCPSFHSIVKRKNGNVLPCSPTRFTQPSTFKKYCTK